MRRIKTPTLVVGVLLAIVSMTSLTSCEGRLDECPEGKLCLFSKADFDGGLKLTSIVYDHYGDAGQSEFDNGAALNDNVTSIVNRRSGHWAILFKNYFTQPAGFVICVKPGGSVANLPGSYDDAISSHDWYDHAPNPALCDLSY